MISRFSTSKNGSKIFYNISGKGPAIVLAHGMGANREMWSEYGWVKLLEDRFTVICIDIRGHGESYKSYDSKDYSFDNILYDIKTVVSDCGFAEYSYFGHSYGATIGLQLWKNDKDIRKVICGGTMFGDEFFKQVVPEWIEEYKELDSKKDNNSLEELSLSEEDKRWVEATDVKLILTQLNAWKMWTGINPNEGNSPLFIYSGTKDNSRVLENLHLNEKRMKENKIKFKVFEELNHRELVRDIEKVSPWVLNFLEENN